MDGIFYYITLTVLGLLSYTFFQNNNGKLALLMLAIGIYIVYSHETGYTATDLKNETLQSLDKSADEWVKEHGTKGFDEKDAQKALK